MAEIKKTFTRMGRSNTRFSKCGLIIGEFTIFLLTLRPIEKIENVKVNVGCCDFHSQVSTFKADGAQSTSRRWRFHCTGVLGFLGTRVHN
jgi:hypothetical protein